MPATHHVVPSPLGPLLAEADDEGRLTGLRFDGTPVAGSVADAAPFAALAEELERYFRREPVEFTVTLAPAGTVFQTRVWGALRRIPAGRTWSYRELAEEVGSNPRAVGQANGQNPIAILVPCHRVIGADGSLVGYAGGMHRKRALLVLEGRFLC